MRFIKELITNKGWNGAHAPQSFDQDDLRRDLHEEGGLNSPLLNRSAQQALDLDDDEELWLNDAGEVHDAADAPDEHASVKELHGEAPDLSADQEDDAEDLHFDDIEEPAPDSGSDGAVSAAFEDEDDEVEEWNLGMDAPTPPPAQEGPVVANVTPVELDEVEEDVFDDPIFLDHDSAEEIEHAAMEAVRTQPDLDDTEKAALLEEIRSAMDAVRHVRTDEERGRQNAARDQLGRVVDAAQDDRILDETNEIMAEDDGARRRHAIALMKAAAEATRTDPELKGMAKRDPALDSAEQSEYRQDLESFAQKRLQTTRPRKSQILDQMNPDEFAEKLDRVTEAVAPEPKANDDAELDGILSAMENDWKEQGNEGVPADTRADTSVDTPVDTPKQADLREALDAARNMRTVELPHEKPQTRPTGEDENGAKNIWELQGDVDDKPMNAEPETPPAPAFQVPPPTQGRAGRQVGRVKTRLLGFQHQDEEDDPFEQNASTSSVTAGVFPVGWIVIEKGPGQGHAFALHAGVTQIGRGDDQGVRLDFGDLAVSRQNHAAIAYDQEQNNFFLGHGGKSNLVRLNGSPVLSTEPLSSGDQIRIGETTLRFVALCSDAFSWSERGA